MTIPPTHPHILAYLAAALDRKRRVLGLFPEVEVVREAALTAGEINGWDQRLLFCPGPGFRLDRELEVTGPPWP